MARDIDERKKRAALRKLRKAAALADAGLGPPLSDWEVRFLEEVEARIEEYGSAFADPSKGNLEDPLSALQKHKLKEIDKKARGKSKAKPRKPVRFSFKSKSAHKRNYSRDINEDILEENSPPARSKPATPHLVKGADIPDTPPRPKGGFKPRIIKGGKSEE